MYNKDMYKEVFIATTDTVPGIGAPVSEKNKKAIYKIKNRPFSKQLIIMVSSIKMAQSLKGWNDKATIVAKKFWPGATTIVVDKTLAVRMPNNKGLLKLIESLGPIYMTSANASGERELTFEEAKKFFKEEIKKHYDFGKGNGKASMIIDLDGKVYR